MTEAAELKHLVLVGASAGGIEALGVLTGSLTADFPAPLVIAQHLDPNRPSQLPSILERRTQLPIVVVGEDTPLEGGKIYVVPSNRHVMIRDGSVRLAGDHVDRPRPSIDLLLSSAAKTYGDRLIAVILTGSGSDGAAGAVEVKDAGGTVIIQNPRTAAYPSMPLALPPTAVDHVAELDQIGPLLRDITHGADLPERIARVPDDVLSDLLSRITRQSHIDFRQYKSNTILRRIGRRMAVNHVYTLEEYREFIEAHPQEVHDLVKSLLIKVTEFFRDPEAFAYLEKEILPGLIAKARERGRVLRMWSAGCATGEEAYSLALLIAQILGNEMHEWSIKVFATDLDADAVNFARRGIYPPPILKSLPEGYLERFFEPAVEGFRVNKALRQMIIFGQQDLGRGVPFPRIDIVVCRNLLIYFKPELQQEVLDLFAYSLHQIGGYLFLGKAETARPSKAVFDLVSKRWKVYRCISGPLPIAVPEIAAVKANVAAVPTAKFGPRESSHTEPPIASDDVQKMRRSLDSLLRHLPIGIVLIDRNYEIFTINGAARRLLGIREVAIDQDFLHSARALPYREVRNAIDRVIQDKDPQVLTELEIGMADGNYVTLHFAPFEGSALELVSLSIFDITEQVQTRRRLEAIQAEQRQLTEELGTTNRRLIEMNKELQDANEELQAANEEMMLAHEELQATNEEFEATNEELQATNEELETNNEELQATNEELKTTNEELHARTGELQEMTRILSGEKQRLREIVELAPFYIVVLSGPALVIERVSPTPPRLFGGEKAIGLTFEEACTDPSLEPLRMGVRRAYAENRAWSSDRIRVGEGADASWYVFTAAPTHGDEGDRDGVVLYVVEITERVELEERDRLERFRVLMENSEQLVMAIFRSNSGRLVHASEHFLRTTQRVKGIDPADAARHTIDELWFGTESIRGQFNEAARTGAPVRLTEVRVGDGADESVWNVALVPIDVESALSRSGNGDGAVGLKAATPGEGTQTEDPKGREKRTRGAHESANESANEGASRYVMVTAVEVTDAVLTRERFEMLDRLKDEFLSLASHELRTPLTPLTAYAELFKTLLSQDLRGPEWERRMNDLVVKLARQVRYISRLTDDLVDVARLQSGKFSLELKPVNLAAIVDQAVEEVSVVAPKPAIRLANEADGELTIQADEVRLKQVVLNLISNAVKHAPGSQIEVHLDRVEHDGGSWARVEVQDNGPGVPLEMRQHLFERFYQAGRGSRSARSGLGLGLYIARRIVEQHDGRIGASFDDGSTRFWIQLPLVS